MSAFEPNSPPIVEVGPNQIIHEKTFVKLDSFAVDPEGDKVSYLWNQIAGPEVKLISSNTTKPSFTAPEVSDDALLKFGLSITDARGAAANTSFVSITVKNINQPPIANASRDQIVNSGDIVTLDGTASEDSDYDRLKYFWEQTSGRPFVALNGAEKSLATFTAPSNISADTNLIFRLMVKDDKNLSSTDDVKITTQYIPPPNKPPTANAGTDQTVNASSIVYLNASKSRDPDGNITSYSWIQTAGPPVILNNTETSIPSFSAPSNISADTPLKFTLTAKDDKGAESKNPALVTITVKHVNHSPIASAGTNQTVIAGYVVSLDGSASKDLDGDALTYSWTQIAGSNVKLDNVNSSLATFTAPSDISADISLPFRLTVTDHNNATATDDVNVLVKYVPLPNQVPVATAGQDQTVNAGDTVALDGTGSSDKDGTISSYSWMQTGGPVVTLDDESVSSPTFTAPSVSFDTTLNFSLTVKDDKDAMSTPTAVSITVKAAPAFTSTPPTTTSLANETNRETSAAAESDFMSTIEGTDEQDNLSGTDEADNIEGHGKDDVIHGQAGNDRIEGDPGNDRLYGDDGNDLIEGGDKDDLLDGGEGDDTLSGGDGDDSMTGGTGKDHFNCGDGNLDRILDYSEGEGDTKAVDCEVITPNISEEQTE